MRKLYLRWVLIQKKKENDFSSNVSNRFNNNPQLAARNKMWVYHFTTKKRQYLKQ